jgi:predicted transposase/invertase (TIGR01784 family)
LIHADIGLGVLVRMTARHDDETLKIIDVGPDRIESIFWADEKEKEQHFAYQRRLMDAYSAEHTHEYLLKQEREKAEQKGVEEGLTKVARNLLRKGLDIEMIIEVSGLSREDIEKLR